MLALKRQQELAPIISENCYKTEFTYPQAEKCEEYMKAKDFKLNMLKSFTEDHLVKHRLAYDKECLGTAEFHNLPSLA